jgi:hypothetical protein
MDPCSEEQPNECNHQAIRDSLQGRRLELCAVLNCQEFLSDEENTIVLTRVFETFNFQPSAFNPTFHSEKKKF